MASRTLKIVSSTKQNFDSIFAELTVISWLFVTIDQVFDWEFYLFIPLWPIWMSPIFCNISRLIININRLLFKTSTDFFRSWLFPSIPLMTTSSKVHQSSRLFIAFSWLALSRSNGSLLFLLFSSMIFSSNLIQSVYQLIENTILLVFESTA